MTNGAIELSDTTNYASFLASVKYGFPDFEETEIMEIYQKTIERMDSLKLKGLNSVKLE